MVPEWQGAFLSDAMTAKIMVVNYTSSGDSFRADKPRLWSPGQFTDRGLTSTLALHPDGKRFAVLKAPRAEPKPLPSTRSASSSISSTSFAAKCPRERTRKTRAPVP